VCGKFRKQFSITECANVISDQGLSNYTRLLTRQQQQQQQHVSSSSMSARKSTDHVVLAKHLQMLWEVWFA